MRGAIPPLPNRRSWRGAQLKHRDNFTLPSHLPVDSSSTLILVLIRGIIVVGHIAGMGKINVLTKF
jgi:hypothetical protein